MRTLSIPRTIITSILLLYTLFALVSAAPLDDSLYNETRRQVANRDKRAIVNNIDNNRNRIPHNLRRRQLSSVGNSVQVIPPTPVPLPTEATTVITPPESTSEAPPPPPPDTSKSEIIPVPTPPFPLSVTQQQLPSADSQVADEPNTTPDPRFTQTNAQSPLSPPPAPPSPLTATAIPPPPPLQVSTLPYPTMVGGLPLSTDATTVSLTTALVTTTVPIVTSYTASNGVVVVFTTNVPTTFVLVGDANAINSLGPLHPSPTGAIIGGVVGAGVAVAAVAAFIIIRFRRKRATSSRNSLTSDIHSEVAMAFSSPQGHHNSGYGSYGESNASSGGSPYGTTGYASGRDARRPSFVPPGDEVDTKTEAAVKSARAKESEQPNGRWSTTPTPWLGNLFGEH